VRHSGIAIVVASALALAACGSGGSTSDSVTKTTVPVRAAIFGVTVSASAAAQYEYLSASTRSSSFSVVTWRFAPGLTWDNAAGYMFAGEGMNALTLATGPRSARDTFMYTSRVCFTF